MVPKPQVFEIVFSNPHKVYKAGDRVTGSLILQLERAQSFRNLQLIFSGKANVAFNRGGSGSSKRLCSATEHYFEKNITILPRAGTSMSNTIDPGHHEFPFIFKLPLDIPSSFQCKVAYVRYIVKAKLEVGWKDVATVSSCFAVFQPLDLNMHETARHSAEREQEKTVCCLFCTGGNVTAKLFIPKSGFVPGESIPFRAEVTNNSTSNISKMYFTVDQTAVCRASGETETVWKILKTGSPPAQHPGITAGSSATWCDSDRDQVIMPVTVPSGLPGCNIICISHELVLHIDIVGVSCGMEVPVAIVIGTMPLESQFYSEDDTVITSPERHGPGYDHHAHSGRGGIYGVQPPAYSPRGSRGDDTTYSVTGQAQLETPL